LNADTDPAKIFLIADPVPDPGFRWPKIGKNLQMKTNLIFLPKKLQFTFPEASKKDAQATGEAFIPQNRISSTSKHEIS
jgi:hypothetical protein